MIYHLLNFETIVFVKMLIMTSFTYPTDVTTTPKAMGTGNRPMENFSRVLVVGDKYAAGFASKVRSSIDKTKFTVEGLTHPNCEVADLIRNIFFQPTHFGHRDHIILMFNTINVSNSESLRIALQNLRHLSKVTNVLLCIQCDTFSDKVIVDRIYNDLESFWRKNRHFFYISVDYIHANSKCILKNIKYYFNTVIKL